MHARELVELAGLASLHARSLVDQAGPLAEDALAEYWVASRCRLDHWGRALRTLGHSREYADAGPAPPSLIALAEEILLSEVFARVIAAVTTSHDAAHGRDEAGPVGRNAWDGCVDARRRVRALAHAWWPAESPKARCLRSIDNRGKHWADLLLGYVARTGDAERFAHDVDRLREFAHDARSHGGAASEGASELLRYALGNAFAAATQPPVCPELNRRIAGAALGLFGPGVFDGVGLLRSPWMIRAERSAEEAIGWVDALLTTGPRPGGSPTADRWGL